MYGRWLLIRSATAEFAAKGTIFGQCRPLVKSFGYHKYVVDHKTGQNTGLLEILHDNPDAPNHLIHNGNFVKNNIVEYDQYIAYKDNVYFDLEGGRLLKSRPIDIPGNYMVFHRFGKGEVSAFYHKDILAVPEVPISDCYAAFGFNGLVPQSLCFITDKVIPVLNIYSPQSCEDLHEKVYVNYEERTITIDYRTHRMPVICNRGRSIDIFKYGKTRGGDNQYVYTQKYLYGSNTNAEVLKPI